MSPLRPALAALALVALSAPWWPIDAARVPEAAELLGHDDPVGARVRLDAPSDWAPSTPRLLLRAAASRAEDDAPAALAAVRAAWERAPRDTRVQRELRRAREALPEAHTPVGPVRPWAVALTPEEVGVLAAGLLAACSALASRARRHPDEGAVGPISATVAVALAALLTLAVAIDGLRATLGAPVGVVTVDGLAARALPDPGEPIARALHRGDEVRVRARTVDHALVEDAGGAVGWVDLEALALPDPRDR
jgi:hypothetical protein